MPEVWAFTERNPGQGMKNRCRVCGRKALGSAPQGDRDPGLPLTSLRAGPRLGVKPRLQNREEPRTGLLLPEGLEIHNFYAGKFQVHMTQVGQMKDYPEGCSVRTILPKETPGLFRAANLSLSLSLSLCLPPGNQLFTFTLRAGNTLQG